MLRHVRGLGCGGRVPLAGILILGYAHLLLHVSLFLVMALAKLQRKPFGEDRSNVAEAHGDVREGKNSASFQDKIHCKLQGVIKNTPDFPGENSTISVSWISSFVLAKTTFFFAKRSKRWRCFPPDGMFLN